MKALSPPIRLIRPADHAYGLIKRRIMLNELPPSTVLTELGLAAELGCSQGTVREALFRLQSDGLVTRTANRGTTVTRLDASEAREMLALRRRIEVNGAAQAVAGLNRAGMDGLLRLRARMDEAAAVGDEFALTEADAAFHLAIFGLTGLEALEHILARCIFHSHRSKLWAPAHRRPLAETAARHDIILDRLAYGDSEGLARELGHHIDTIVSLGAEGGA